MQWTISTVQLATLIPFIFVCADIVRRFIRDRKERRGYALPPGPTPIPILGSALSVNFEESFKTYTEWRTKYGDLMYIRLLDMDVVVLNSISVASDLLEKRSPIYSDRPFIATVKPYGHDTSFAFEQYNDHLKLCRKIFHQTFSSDAAVSFYPIQLRKARQIVLNLLENPNNYSAHYWTFSSAVTLLSVYDYDPSPHNDQMVSVINNFLDTSVPALMPEKAVLIKTFPFLLRIPDWLPGSSMKHEARKARELSVEMVEAPYQHIKKRMESEENVNLSMVSDHITRMAKLDDSRRSEYERALKQACAGAIMGAVESTTSLLLTFTLAMVENPQVWKRAQADIDTVIGTRRLPEFHDRPSLPYIDAIMRETMRWQPTIPLGAPHATATSDIYNNFYIPKGATIFANIWGMTRDESRYSDPDKFFPERFLDGEGMLNNDSVDYVFGFGRRACPGQHTAYGSLWSAMVTMLATLDFNLAKDADGKDIAFEAKFMNGMARHPLPFPCSITPRSHINKESLG